MKWSVSAAGVDDYGNNVVLIDGAQNMDAVDRSRMIKSAPELLSALKGLVDIQDVEEHDSPERELSDPHDCEICALCAARAAIAKAEGKC